jgi:hypothetical protein
MSFLLNKYRLCCHYHTNRGWLKRGCLASFDNIRASVQGGRGRRTVQFILMRNHTKNSNNFELCLQKMLTYFCLLIYISTPLVCNLINFDIRFVICGRAIFVFETFLVSYMAILSRSITRFFFNMFEKSF